MAEVLTQHSLFETLTCDHWQSGFAEATLAKAQNGIENGQIIYFPHLAFHLFPAEMPLLSTRFSVKRRKNISYNRLKNALHGTGKITEQDRVALRGLLLRYAEHARYLVENLFPPYQPDLAWGRTSYRPLPISNQPLSPHKDDKRLHVDAFPATPNQGKRILRVFCNINPQGEDRIWRIGEPFETVANHFLPQTKKPLPGSSSLLKLLGITKSLRTPYDHYMLQIHDKMKEDETYQRRAQQTEVRFPPGSTWIVFSDHVSHAAMSGQYMLEQTFYLPVTAMQNPELSPLRILERKMDKLLTRPSTTTVKS